MILPDFGALPEQSANALRRFVDEGGAVMSTGSSAWSAGIHQLDPEGEHLTQKAVFDTVESLRSLHLDISADLSGQQPGLAANASRRPVHVPALGEFRALGLPDARDATAVDGVPEGDQGERRWSRTGWPVLGRALYGPPEKCYGNEDTGHPGRVSWQAASGGTVTVLPWLPGTVLREVGLSAVGDALAAQITATAGEHLRWRTTLPAHVRLVPGHSAHGPILHLLNRSGERPQRFVDPAPASPAELEIPCADEPREVRALVADQELEWSWTAGVLHLRTPRIGVFEVIAVRP